MSFLQEHERFNGFGIQNYLHDVTENQINNTLQKESLSALEFLSLLSPKAEPFLEDMARKAHKLTVCRFGRTILLYTPMYLANYCTNRCLYCGFSADNKIKRKQLSFDEVENEAAGIARTGLKHVLVLTGDAKKISTIDYLRKSIGILRRHFTSISIEIYALETDEYQNLVHAGVDGLTMYQETYNRELYDSLHVKGPKKNFNYRLEAPERACDAGMRTVNVGALLGLDNWPREVFFTGLHAAFLQKKYPDVEVSISLPRIRPHVGEFNPQHIISDKNLVQIMTAIRLFLPRVGITVSTREEAKFRDRIIRLGVTKMSAGSTTAVGGHTLNEEKSFQFDISDNRTVEQMALAIRNLGYQPVFKDWHPII